MVNYLKLLRTESYIKNILIFFPLFFTPSLWELSIFIDLTIIVFFFSLCCSSVYIWNDISDMKLDSLHPIKKNRVLAKGIIKKNTGLKVSILLIILSLSFFLFYKFSLIYLIISYILLNLIYNFFFKNIVLLDVLTVSLFYVLRILIGSLAINISPTSWILSLTFFTSLFVILCKRKDSFNKSFNTKRNIYNDKLLNILIYTNCVISIFIYIFYSFSEDIFIQNNLFPFSSIFVVFGFLRFLKIIYLDKDLFDPVLIFVRDKYLRLTVFFWLLFLLILNFI